MRFTYYSKNIGQLKFRINGKKGGNIEDSFSFVARKASDDVLAVSDGKFSVLVE